MASVRINPRTKFISNTMYKLISAISLTLVFITSSQVLAANDCRLPNNYVVSPPQTSEGVYVKISVFVLDIERIDDSKQEFIADIIVDLIWSDPVLGRLAKTANSICRLQLNAVWNPEVLIFNERKLSKRFPQLVKVNSKGEVVYTQRYYGTFASPLSLQEFPFDRQELPFLFSSLQDIDHVNLQFNPTLSGYDKSFSLAGWNLLDTSSQTSIYRINTEQGHSGLAFSKLNYSFHVQRDISFYRWKVVLPLSLIVIMSWAVFWIEPGQIGPRLGVSTTSILTLIAFLFSLRGILPPVSYLTRIDMFIYGSLALIFATHVVALITSNFSSKERFNEAYKLIKVSRIFAPFIFVLLGTIFILG